MRRADLMYSKWSVVFLIALAFGLLPRVEAVAQKPVIKVDFNFSGRKEIEVNEPSYFAWPVKEGLETSRRFGNVKITVEGDFSSDWYKAGVQSPFLARWVNDGIVSAQPLRMTITGLPEGKHTLLTSHNTFANPEGQTFAPIDIYVDGQLAKENLSPSNRAENTTGSETAYLNLDAKAGKSIEIRFEVDPVSTASLKNVVLNGFEINIPNIKKQARKPLPVNGDEHVVDSGGKLTLQWSAAKGITSHEVYFGTSKEAVETADQSSPVYKGSQAETTYDVAGLYSMETYYWRVDEVDSEGEVTKGDVWYFRPAQLAFPGAEGYGRFARGGRGGKVVEVTNLNDSGPGSFREAVTRDIGPRTVVFSVSGNIQLKSRLIINQPYITVAGQTAPGKGITISRAPVGLTGNDGIARFLRVRVGAGRTYDGMGLTGANHSIIDHCSISWTIDEAFSSRGAKNITLQRTLISEALNVAGHGKYESGQMHGYAATIGGDVGSFHHNLLAHCYGRNWSMGGGLSGNGIYTGRLDIRNNVVYNWGKRSTDGGAHEVNFVNNFYKPGPATVFFYALKAQHERIGGGTQQYFFTGNVMPGHFDEDNQTKGRTIQGKVDYKTYVDKPFFPSHVTTQSAEEAYKHVLSDVGCNQPVFDEHDQRIIEETLNGTYQFKGSKSGIPGMPDTHEDVGGWEEYPQEQRESSWDADHDGLPGWWENLHGLNPASEPGDFSETNADPDKDGFTNLDLYLQWMANPHYFIKTGEKLKIDLQQLFRGFSDGPVYKIAEVENGRVTLSRNNKKALFTSDSSGLSSFSITVKDEAGSSMTRKIGLYVAK